MHVAVTKPFSKLEDLPNIGKSITADLRSIGIFKSATTSDV
jgi:hypothetical protein